ncbi:hypothetical protein QTP86_018760 [Hemibagrus guttatus]|nr:hypothetical protein QTP86_018760 [Hemibagrus guttatus]
MAVVVNPGLDRSGGRLFCLVLWLNVVPVLNGCPAKCVCYSEPRPTMACQQQGLFSIPTEIPVRSQRIFLQSNKLTVGPFHQL